MKTSNVNIKSRNTLLLLSFLFCFVLKSQCSQTVNNNLNCNVKFNVIVYDCVPSNCYSQTGISIGPGGSYPIICSACSTLCNIEVYVIDVGGNAVTPGPADFTSGAIAVSSFCGATNTIDYDSINLVFNISY